MNRYDVLVIGGGVIGAAILQSLARRGIRSALIERSEPASGATGSSGGMVRVFHQDSRLSDLAAESLPTYHAFEREVGESCGFTQTGCLYIATEADRPRLMGEVTRLAALGCDVMPMAAAEARRRFPEMHWADHDWVIYEPPAGYADPQLTTNAWLRLAARHGADIVTHTPIERLLSKGDHIIGVQSGGQTWFAERVILATGLWSRDLLHPLGIEPALTGRAIQLNHHLTRHHVAHPCFFDLSSHSYGRPHADEGSWVGLGSSDDPDAAGPRAWQSESGKAAVEQASERLPHLSTGLLKGGMRAVDAYSSDRLGQLGPCPGISGLFLAAGWGGTGFKLAPAIGERAANLLLATL